MKYTLSLKHFHLSSVGKYYFERNIEKIEKLLPHIEEDAATLILVLSKEHAKRLNRGAHDISGKEVITKRHPKKLTSIYYSGALSLRLPRETIRVRLSEPSVEEAVLIGFDTLLRRLKKYKSIHFSSESEYPSREKLREKLFE